MTKIVIIEDDQDIRDLVNYTLEVNGMEGFGFSDYQSFLDAKIMHVDLFILDVMLPKEDGLQIIENLKKQSHYNHAPIIMLTAKGSELDKVKALNLGADDYIVKPFGVLELVARIKARLRHIEKNVQLTFKDIVLNVERYELKVEGEIVSLTNKEFEILKYLMENVNRVISRESLLEKIWGYDFEGESRTLDIHISTLRKQLKSQAQYLQTVRGVGYKLGDIHD